MSIELFRSTLTNKNEQTLKRKLTDDSVPITSATLITSDKEPQNEHVRIFIF